MFRKNNGKDTIEKKLDEDKGFELVETALKVPGVKVDRTKFLTKVLKNEVPQNVLDKAIAEGTDTAGIPVEIIRKAANECIKETKKASTTESAITGLPGSVVGISVGVAADLTQFHANLIILIQKLAYLYGMKDMCSTHAIMAFMGCAYGIHGMDTVVKIITKGMTKQYAKQAGKFILFTKPALYSISKKVAKSIGVSISKKGFAKAASKAVPVIGSVISAGLNWITFSPMAANLLKTLEESYNKPLSENEIAIIEKMTENNGSQFENSNIFDVTF